MIKHKVYNQQAEVVGEQELAKTVFALTINQGLVHQAAVTQMANSRSVIADTKDRSEVSGGGRKPWKQKGTGRARAGSNRSPLWVGGGVTFGPTTDRNFSKKINKKMLSQAICMVLSDRQASGNLIIVDDLKIKDGKTKELKVVLEKLLGLDSGLAKLKIRPRALILTSSTVESLKLASRNLPRVQVINDQNINIVSLLRAKKLIISQAAVEQLNQRYGSKTA